MFRNIPLILLFLIVIITLFGNNIPLNLKETMYGLSLSIKSLIICILPFIIFSLLFKASVNIAKDAPKFILLILVGVVLSNFIATFLSYFLGSACYNLDMHLNLPTMDNTLTPSIHFEFPRLIPNDIAMFGGLILGFITYKLYPEVSSIISNKLSQFTTLLLRIVSLGIPVFVAGFIIKMEHEGTVNQIIMKYPLIFALIALTQVSYITLFYFIANKFNLAKTLICIRNILPASISGFSTMSSAASMPLTIVGTEKNAKNKDLVHTIVPATVNIHLIGDCIAIPSFAFAVIKTFGLAQPDLLTYMIFTFYFVIAKFSVAAIPGGGIMVMVPVLIECLGFNSDMISLIISIYILFDPVITAANVFGNGAFAKFIDSVFYKMNTIKSKN
jgi:Na+/H+-dicarboxylate symporter